MRVVNRTLAAILLLATAPAVIGCGPAPPPRAKGKIVAATGILPHQWLIGQVGGDHVEAIALVKPGDSAELYQPTDAEVSRLMRAAVYFRSGMPFESSPWLAAIQANPRTHLVDLRAGITLRPMDGHGHNEAVAVGPAVPAGPADSTANDPHVWLSPFLLKVQARTVAEQLQALDPAHAKDYQANLKVLETRLDQADQSIRETLQPLRGKAIFVFHPAWGYFAAEYGLRQVAIQVEGKEPTDHELTQLQKLARQEGVKVIFVQPQFASGAPEAMARAIGGRVETLDDLGPDVIAGLLETAKKLADAYR